MVHTVQRLSQDRQRRQVPGQGRGDNGDGFDRQSVDCVGDSDCSPAQNKVQVVSVLGATKVNSENEHFG